MSCRNISWLLWTLTLIQKLWFWVQYKRKILLLFAKILMFWYSITFLIYDSAEPKQTRQKLFGKLIKETLMDVSSSIRAYRAKNLLAPPMHSILFTTVNCLHIFRKTTVWNHSQCLKINKNVLFNICRYFAFGLIILLTNRVHSKNALKCNLKFDCINDTFLSIFKHCVA